MLYPCLLAHIIHQIPSQSLHLHLPSTGMAYAPVLFEPGENGLQLPDAGGNDGPRNSDGDVEIEQLTAVTVHI